MTLRPLQGHSEARRALARAHSTGDLPAALLIHGPRGVGKQRTALWIAQLILCGSAGPDGACGECKDCRLALKLEHPDLHWFFPLPRLKGSHSPEKQSELLEEARAEALEERRNGLWSTFSDEVRGLYLAMARTLRKMAQRKSAMSESQIFVIAEAEELVPQESSPEAANSLLKLLEEPPEGTFFILTSARPGHLLPTIRSRTFPLHLSPLDESEVVDYLVREREVDEKQARKAAHLAQGSIGRALDYLPDGGEKGPLEDLREASFHILHASLSPKIGDGFALAESYPSAGARGYLAQLSHLEEWLRDLAAAAAGRPEAVVNEDGREYLVRMARDREIHPVAVARAFEPVEEARIQAAGNVNPQLIVADLVGRLRRILLASSLRRNES